MALTQFIKDLLYTCDKLIIPGFGGFVAQYTSAQINSEKSILLPPAKHFIFDAGLTEDDGIFSDYVSKKVSKSLLETNNMVNEMVTEFWKKLNEGNTLLIEEVGYFSLDESKQIRFQREDDKDFNSDNYGLGTVPIRQPVQQTQTWGADEMPVRKKHAWVRILIFFLIINIIGALSAIIYWKYDQIKAYFQHFSAAKQDTVPDYDSNHFVITPDTTPLGQSIDTSTNIKNALRYQESPKTDSVKKDKTSEGKYYLIAGSFQSYKKAEAHAKFLKKQGMNPEIIEFSHQLFRISVGEYISKEEALQQLDIIKRNKSTESAWLLLK